MDAVILAGGAGTRLRSVVNDLPKPMADLNGRPFLCCLLDCLLEGPVDKVILSVGYRRESIMGYFGDCYRTLPLVYAVEDEPLGTGGAIRESLSYATGEHVLILNGDTFFPVDLEAMVAAHLSEGCDLTMALKLMTNFDRYGAVECCDNRVTGFAEKGFRPTGYINGGVYVMQRKLAKEFPGERRFSFEEDFLQAAVQHLNICAYQSDAYFIDIGIPDDYLRAQRELTTFPKEET